MLPLIIKSAIIFLRWKSRKSHLLTVHHDDITTSFLRLHWRIASTIARDDSLYSVMVHHHHICPAGAPKQLTTASQPDSADVIDCTLSTSVFLTFR